MQNVISGVQIQWPPLLYFAFSSNASFLYRISKIQIYLPSNQPWVHFSESTLQASFPLLLYPLVSYDIPRTQSMHLLDIRTVAWRYSLTLLLPNLCIDKAACHHCLCMHRRLHVSYSVSHLLSKLSKTLLKRVYTKNYWSLTWNSLTRPLSGVDALQHPSAPSYGYTDSPFIDWLHKTMIWSFPTLHNVSLSLFFNPWVFKGF